MAEAEQLQEDVLAELERLVASDDLPGAGDDFLRRANDVADRFLGTGDFAVSADPFGGKDADLMRQTQAYYLLFWRLFDRTPAALMQDFAIRVRRILAQKVFKRVGEDVIFHHDVYILSGLNTELGNGVFVNRGSTLDDRGPIVVGDHTMIAAGAILTTHGHILDDFSKPLPFGGRTFAPITIGSNTVIGFNAVVMPDVTIGDRVIVAANSVVTSDVPDRWVVGGVPAKKIKELVPRSEGGETAS